ncbi:hypothetical protein HDU93_006448 [Gonapodya sp. JEL0774]|nr:hypothetical protein HDU93_006448 [Gonapodya sp. JEL0774]
MNYLTFHAEKYNLTQEQIDSSRLSAAKMSPMMDAMETCIIQIDERVMNNLAPKLAEVIRRGVGLPTKAGSAKILVSLTVQIPSLLQPHSELLLRALVTAMKDRNAAIRKSMGVAIGYTAKLAPPESMRKLIAQMQTSYFDPGE